MNFWPFFKRIPTTTRINDEIHDLEIKLLANMFNADHYKALAEGNKASIARLTAMREAIVSGDSGVETTQAIAKAKTGKVRAAVAA